MTTREWRRRGARRAQWSAFAVVALLYPACTPSEPSVGSETHFLVDCATSCPAGTECLCGVCTQRCVESEECSRLESNASCFATAPRVAQGRCPATAQPQICDLSCLVDRDCAVLGGSA